MGKASPSEKLILWDNDSLEGEEEEKSQMNGYSKDSRQKDSFIEIKQPTINDTIFSVHSILKGEDQRYPQGKHDTNNDSDNDTLSVTENDLVDRIDITLRDLQSPLITSTATYSKQGGLTENSPQEI